MEECAVRPVMWAAGGEKLLTRVVRAKRRGGGGLAAMAAGHSGEYAMREKIFRKLIWHDGMMLRREVQRYGLTEGGMYRRNYAAGCSFTSLKRCVTLTLRCNDIREINIA